MTTDGVTMRKMKLMEWWKKHYSSEYCPRKLRRWVRLGYISPQPIIHGREYYVDENATYKKPDKQSSASMNFDVSTDSESSKPHCLIAAKQAAQDLLSSL
ncbi:excisionase [Shewanella frigidimarina]|uniref:excisionase n=1 Tax=Shewanella frigidimarina TaxID=56812 RepID=UPI003D793FE0